MVSEHCLLKHISSQTVNEAADQQKNDPKSRWDRSVFLAGRLMDGDALHHGQAVHMDQKGLPPVYTKELAEQHWLELVDGYFISFMQLCYIYNIYRKHRYGSNRTSTLSRRL